MERSLELLATFEAAGVAIRRIVWTENRRVMISLGGRQRAVLRLHRHFAAAPEPVVGALARWIRDPRSREGKQALATVRTFLSELAPAAPVPRPREALPGDEVQLARLRAEFDRVNACHFDGSLPTVPIHLSGRMRRRNGHYCCNPPEIVISRTLCLNAAEGEAEHTLRHEMIHLWQHQSGVKLGHGSDFRRWARRLDVHPRATRPVTWYAPGNGG